MGGGLLLWKYSENVGKTFRTEEQNGERGEVAATTFVADKKTIQSEILAIIRDGESAVSGITPREAEEELKRRATLPSDGDTRNADATTLPFGILQIIAKSPIAVAGIAPQAAINEIVRRYLALKAQDPNNMGVATMLEALQSALSGNPMEEWEKKDDSEDAEAFLKQIGEEGNAIAALATAARSIYRNPGDISSLDAVKKMINSDAFDNDNDKEVFDAIVKKIGEMEAAVQKRQSTAK
jgi:hypothetical protein